MSKNIIDSTEEKLEQLPWNVGDIYPIDADMYERISGQMVGLEFDYLVIHDIYISSTKEVDTTVDELSLYVVMDVRFSNGEPNFVFIDTMRERTAGEYGCPDEYTCPECDGEVEVEDDNMPDVTCTECDWGMHDGNIWRNNSGDSL